MKLYFKVFILKHNMCIIVFMALIGRYSGLLLFSRFKAPLNTSRGFLNERFGHSS